jgi:hypothetical protein
MIRSWMRSSLPAPRVLALASLAMLALVATAGAKHAGSQPWPGTYVASEYAAYDTAGTAVIEGTGAASPAEGMHVTIAGNDVALTPATSWSALWWDRWVRRGYALENGDRRATRYICATTADSAGHFRFERLPAGRYYLRSQVLLASGVAGQSGASLILVVLAKQLTLAPGEHATIALDSLRSEGHIMFPGWEDYQRGYGATTSWEGIPPPLP